MALLYVVAGLNHFLNAEFYIKTIPWYLFFPIFLTYLSGACEIILGILLISERTRRIAAAFIIAMLTVYFIIHVQMIIDFSRQGNPLLWLAILRIPLQFVLIWWAWIFVRRENSLKEG